MIQEGKFQCVSMLAGYPVCRPMDAVAGERQRAAAHRRRPPAGAAAAAGGGVRTALLSALSLACCAAHMHMRFRGHINLICLLSAV